MSKLSELQVLLHVLAPDDQARNRLSQVLMEHYLEKTRAYAKNHSTTHADDRQLFGYLECLETLNECLITEPHVYKKNIEASGDDFIHG